MLTEHNKSRLRRTKGSVVRPSTEAALRKLGQDIEFARKVRGLSAEAFAQSVGISRSTLHRLETGNGAGVSLNTLAMVLTVLGKLELLSDLIDMRKDDIGLSLLRDDVMQRAKPTKIARTANPVNRSGTPQVKRATGTTATPTHTNNRAKEQENQSTLVVSPSGRTSTLLSRLKAKRDARSA